jgi:hypothetical protein
MPTKSIFSALGAPMSLAWVRERPCVEGSALPKSVESGKLSLNKVGIGLGLVPRLRTGRHGGGAQRLRFHR